jgi:subtilase family serine protease
MRTVKVRLRPLGLTLLAALVCVAAASATPVHQAGTFYEVFAGSARAGQTPACPILCYSPANLRQVYDFPAGGGAPTGAGQTIVLVDAYGAPDIQTDLPAFDAAFGIPDPPSFSVLHQSTVIPGAGDPAPDLMGWQIETALDVEYAHAMAPGANIVLAVANSDDSADLAEVEREVLPQYPSAIVSQSFGLDETGPGSDPNFQATVQPLYWNALLHGGTILASSGDFGASNGTEFEGVTPSPMASFPASSPLVLAVGGTEGHPYPDGLFRNGHYGAEEVWNEPQLGSATGGAPSVVFRAPFWQLGLTGVSGRAEPDVSYNAAIQGGVVIIFSCLPDGNGGLTCNPSTIKHAVVGGTSAGVPQWAAIVALANELRGRQGARRLGLVAPYLYLLARDGRAYHQDFHDISLGDNTLAGSAFGFSAKPGYDLATGLGTPDVSALLRDLTAFGGRDDLAGLTAPPAHGGPDHGGRGHAGLGR